MPKFTTDQINRELEALENTEAQAASYYLKLELKRRKRSGRKSTGKAVPVKERVRKHRANMLKSR